MARKNQKTTFFFGEWLGHPVWALDFWMSGYLPELKNPYPNEARSFENSRNGNLI